MTKLVVVIRIFYSDSGSLPDISTASNAASQKKRLQGDRVRRDTYYIFTIMNETSDVSINRSYVYILYSLSDKGFYIGFTSNLKLRLTKHAKGQVTATKFRRPLRLIHYEYFINKEDAMSREKFLKSGYGRRQLKEILKKTIIQINNI